MRVLVTGGRDFVDRQFLCNTLDGLRERRRVTVLIAGGAGGADTFAAEWAEARQIKCQIFQADRMRLGRCAGPIRNQQMLDEGRPELVVAFRGGCRTVDMMRRARKASIAVIEVCPNSSLSINAPDVLAWLQKRAREGHAVLHLITAVAIVAAGLVGLGWRRSG